MPNPLFLSAITASLMLAGCAAGGYAGGEPAMPQPAAETYVAQGHEPGWRVEISSSHIDYTGDYGETRLRSPYPGPVQENGRTLFQGQRISVTAEQSGCADSAVERQYRDKVTVMADGRQVTGCGGPVLPPATLNGTRWRFQAVAGTPVSSEREADIQFNDGRIGGSAGCNRMMGEYQQQGDQLRASNLASTRMACAPDLMAQEQAIHSALRSGTSIHFLANGTMQLRTAEGVTLDLQQIF